MVLTVDFASFAQTAQRLTPGKTAYLSVSDRGVTVATADPAANVLVRAHSPNDRNKTRDELLAAGLSVDLGSWADCEPNSGSPNEAIFVAAVAYRSTESKPGLWVDIFAAKPTTSDVLNAFYQEMSTEGSGAPMSLDQFVRHADPNVVILEPDEIQAFLRKRSTSLTD